MNDNLIMSQHWKKLLKVFICYAVSIITYIVAVNAINNYFVPKDEISQGGFFTVCFLIGIIILIAYGVYLLKYGNCILKAVNFKFRWYHIISFIIVDTVFFLYCFTDIELPFLINVFGSYPLYVLFVYIKMKIHITKSK